MPKDRRPLTDAQRDYEARRAARAGMSLEKWLAQKDRQVDLAARDEAKARKVAEARTKPPGFFARLIERAQKPL